MGSHPERTDFLTHLCPACGKTDRPCDEHRPETEVDRLLAENERLREALRRIRRFPTGWTEQVLSICDFIDGVLGEEASRRGPDGVTP